jgi:hypothetical protein
MGMMAVLATASEMSKRPTMLEAYNLLDMSKKQKQRNKSFCASQ